MSERKISAADSSGRQEAGRKPEHETERDGALPDTRIVDFIRKHHVMTLATSAGNTPYCANLFYAYLGEANCFAVTSSDATRHGAEARLNPCVAGSIVLETRMVGNVQGLQFQGTMRRPAATELSAVRKGYLRRFPYAAVMDLELWIITLEWAKLTDNRLGFGKKLHWESPGHTPQASNRME